MQNVLKAALIVLTLLWGLPVAAEPWDLYRAADAYNANDYETALKLWRQLAEWGYADAQYSLGFMYKNGHAVTQDYVQAHKWYDIAVSNGSEIAAKERDKVANLMAPAQIAEAQRLAREWLKANQGK